MGDSPATVHLLLPEVCIVSDRGAVLGIYRAPIQGPLVPAVRAAILDAASSAPRGLLSIGVFRLSPEFPLGTGLGANKKELAELLRTLDRSFVAHAIVIEFGGVRAATMRLITAAIRKLVRTRAPFSDFDGLTDAVTWLRPHAERARVPTDHAAYLRLYREAERRLDELDARRGATARPARR